MPIQLLQLLVTCQFIILHYGGSWHVGVKPTAELACSQMFLKCSLNDWCLFAQKKYFSDMSAGTAGFMTTCQLHITILHVVWFTNWHTAVTNLHVNFSQCCSVVLWKFKDRAWFKIQRRPRQHILKGIPYPEVGKVTLKSNGDESLEKSDGNEPLNDDPF